MLNKLSIIVVTFNSMEVIPTFMKCLKKTLKGESCQIIICDNNSSDNISEYIEINHPRVKFISMKTNLGFGFALNKGIEAADTPYVALMNPDVAVRPSGFQYLLEFLEENRKAAAVSGAIRGCKNLEEAFYTDNLNRKIGFVVSYDTIATRMIFYSGMRKHFKSLQRMVTWSSVKPKKNIKTFALNGCFGVFKKRALFEIGLFDPKLFLFFEEADIGIRLRKKGYELYYTNKTEIYHLRSKGSKNSLSLQTNKILLNSQYLFFNKHYGITYAWISFVLIWLLLSIKLICQCLLLSSSCRITCHLWLWHLKFIASGGRIPEDTIPNVEDINKYSWTMKNKKAVC